MGDGIFIPRMEKEGETMTWEMSKIWSIVRKDGDIDDMIFANESKSDPQSQTQIHSER